MRLRWLCLHEYRAVGTAYGENLLGMGTWAVVFRCIKCLKTKYDEGYSSEASAQAAAERIKAIMEGK
jgi:hypothetical protein